MIMCRAPSQSLPRINEIGFFGTTLPCAGFIRAASKVYEPPELAEYWAASRWQPFFFGPISTAWYCVLTGVAGAPAVFIHPCQPIVVAQPPSGPCWAHELKHDGYRLQIHVRDDKS